MRLAVHKERKTAYALKGMHKGHLIATHQVENVVGEKKLLMQVSHPFIMRCFDAYASRTHVYLLLGIAMGGDVPEVSFVHPYANVCRRIILAHVVMAKDG